MAVIIVVIAGSILRFLPIGYGLPFFYHPDETHLMFDFGKFLEGVAHGNVSIGTTAFSYPLGASYGSYYLLGRITGRFSSVSDFKHVFLLADQNLVLLGRILSVIFSIGSLILTYFLAKQVYGQRAGIIAATLMAVSLIDISSSHWMKLDSTVAFMSLLSVLAMVRLSRQEGLRPSLFAGMAVGLAIATRIDSLVLLPLMVFAHLLESDGQACRIVWRELLGWKLGVALGVTVLTYLLVSFRLWEILSVHVLRQAPLFKTREVGASLIEYFLAGDVVASIRHNVGFYFYDVLIGTFGIALTGLVLVGFARMILSQERQELIIIGFLVLCLVPILMFNVYGTHYMLRIVPFLMVMASGAILSLLSWKGKQSSLLWAASFVLLAMAQPAYFSVRYDEYLLTNTDTRTRAREWIYQSIPFGERIAVQKYNELPRYLPTLHETRAQVERKLAVVRSDSRSSGLAFEAMLASYPEDTYDIINLSIEQHWNIPGANLENLYDYEQLIAQGVRYVVMSGPNSPSTINEDGSPIGILIARRFLDHEGLRRYEAFVRLLRERGRLVAEFVPADATIARRTDAPIDPTIRVYSIG